MAPHPATNRPPGRVKGSVGGRGHNAATSSVKVFLYHILCRYNIYKLSRASTSTQNFSFRLFSLSFFLFFFFYTASIFLPIFTFKRQRRQSQSHSPPPHLGLHHTATICWCPKLGLLDGRVGRISESLFCCLFTFFTFCSLSFCEVGTTCCCGCVSRLSARFA